MVDKLVRFFLFSFMFCYPVFGSFAQEEGRFDANKLDEFLKGGAQEATDLFNANKLAIRQSRKFLLRDAGASRSRKAIQNMRTARIRANQILRRADANIRRALENARRHASRENSDSSVEKFIKLTAQVYTLASSMSALASSLEDVDLGRTKPSEKHSLSYKVARGIASTSIDNGLKRHKEYLQLKRDIMTLKNTSPDWTQRPGVRLTKNEVILKRVLGVLAKMKPSAADKFENNYKMTFENTFKNLVDGGAVSIVTESPSVADGLILFMRPQVLGDGDVGSQHTFNMMWQDVGPTIREYWRWRNGSSLLDIEQFAEGDDEGILRSLECQNGCIRSK